jgi:trigger factor
MAGSLPDASACLPYTPRAMNVTASPAPRSSILLEIELPAERLTRAIERAVRDLSRRTRVPGFRPGKAPRPILERVLGPGAVLDEAVEHLVHDSYREALVEKAIRPLANADVEIVQAEEGKPVIFRATVPIRPEVRLGDYRAFPFGPEVDPVDESKVDKVIDELVDQNATLAPIEDRGAQKGDYAVIGFEGTTGGQPFPGGTSERMPVVIGEDRLIPGFEDHLIGLRVGEGTEFDITFPDDYVEQSLAGQQAHFSATIRELREKVRPEADDDFARSMGSYDDMAGLRARIRERLQTNALDTARHAFADRIIEYAADNAELELPEILIDQEVEVMHDELRGSLARQGIPEDAYLQITGKTHEELHADLRPGAEKRVRVLLVLSKIAEVEGIAIPDEDVEAEIDGARTRYGNDRTLMAYFESERGRSYIRSSLRRTRLIEGMIDEWLAAHPEFGPLPHLEEQAGAAVAGAAQANAALDVTDPGSLVGTAIGSAEPMLQPAD